MLVPFLSDKMLLDELEKDLVFLVERSPSAQAADIVAAISRVDALSRKHAHELHPRLLHFLQGRSYQKALALVRGERPQAGPCRGN